MKNRIVKSTIVLSISCLISKLLGAFYKIPLSNILGANGIGVYQMIFPVYALLLVFITGGLPIYVSQKTAELRANNDFGGIVKLKKLSINIALLVGFCFGLVLFVLAKPLALFQGNSMAMYGYIAISVSVAFSCVTSVYKGVFQGYENMIPSSITQIIEQFFKLVFGLLFASFFVVKGVEYGVCGAFVAITISEIISYLFMITYYKIKTSNKIYEINNSSSLSYKSIIHSFLPISLNSSVMPLMAMVDSFMVINLLVNSGFDTKTSTSLFGIVTGMINPLINFPIIFSVSICTVILPALTFRIKSGENITSILNNCFKFIWCISLPCVVGIIILSPEIIATFFPVLQSEYVETAVLALRISSFNIIWISFIQTTTSVLQSYNKFVCPLKNLLLCFVVKILLTVAFVLKPELNIIGLCIANSIAYSLASVLNLIKIKKITNFNIKFNKLIIPIIISFIMGYLIYLFNNIFDFNIYLNLLISVFLGAIFYLINLFIFNIWSKKEIIYLFKK